MQNPPVRMWLALAVVWSVMAVQSLPGLSLRNRSDVRQTRLMNYPGPPVLPYYGPLAPNARAITKPYDLSGIGWPDHGTEWFRQLALVSPQHFLCATHYPLTGVRRISFLGANGVKITMPIAGGRVVKNAAGKPTDIMLYRLEEPLPAVAQVAAFPVAAYPYESSYFMKPLLFVGSAAICGTGQIVGFENIAEAPFEDTRFAYSDYLRSGVGRDDAYYVGGDSGTPAFITENNKALLVGTASYMDDESSKARVRSSMAFIPTYLNRLDRMMEADGYHVIRHPAVVCALQSGVRPVGTLRKGAPGTIWFTLRHASGGEAHNVTTRVTFDSPPDTFGGPGWICTRISKKVWECRRGGIKPGAAETITANWAKLPSAAKLSFTDVSKADGAASMTTTHVFGRER